MTLNLDLARHLDPVLLARDCGIEPDPWQQNLLRNNSLRVLMLCARQVGKTETAVCKALWTALYDPGLIIIVSPSQRQSAEVFKRFLQRYANLGDVPELVAESALRCELSNGSRIVSLPGSEKTTRGYAAVKLCLVDEASRCDDELFAAIRPTLGTVDGTLIMLSTPNGKRGEFYRAWTEGEGWHRVKVAADQCPRLSQEFLDEEFRELGPQMFKQEYGLEFVDDIEAVFSTAIIDRAFSDEVRPLWQ